MAKNRCLIFAFLLLLLAGCKTSQQAVPDGISAEQGSQVHSTSNNGYLSKRLGINITSADKGQLALYEAAADWIGTPYRYGGASKDGTDCSGLVMQLYKSVYQKVLERNSARIKERNCYDIRKNQLLAGDLVFFSTGSKKGINHVGIYLKEGKFIHSSSSKGVIVSTLEDSYYMRTYVCSGRVK